MHRSLTAIVLAAALGFSLNSAGTASADDTPVTAQQCEQAGGEVSSTAGSPREGPCFDGAYDGYLTFD
ncbi:hypothetical protein [Streptomyces sp. NPDC006285]|uniref:hypothetical protein n=1 Tax=Streptomyces sp. NPDC006285 TaxID=3364742 RepID=UPI003682EFB8